MTLDNRATAAALEFRPVRNEEGAEVEDELALYVYDVIDPYWGAGALQLKDALAANPVKGKTLNLRVNSPGGDVFEAQAMVSLLKASGAKNIIGHIDGLAASAASWLVTDAADTVNMADGALFMIHNSFSFAYGNAKDMQETAALLQKVDGMIAAKYAQRTGGKVEDMAALMDATTWFTAQEAKDAKFIDAIAGEPVKADNASRWDISALPKAPANYQKLSCAVGNDVEAVRAKRERQLRMYHIGSANGA